VREKMVSVSVIIPTVNDKRIYRAIETLKNQDCEIIVVQNGTEKPWEELKGYCENNGITFIHFKEGNLSKAYNIGSKIASGEIIVHADSDTYFTENFIDDVKKQAKKGWIIKGGQIFDDFGEKIVVGGQAIFLYKSDFERIGGYDEEFAKPHATDVAFCLRARQKGVRSKVIPKAIFYHPPTAHKRGFKVGMAEAKAIKKYPGHLKMWRMLGADVLEIFRIIRHMIGLIVGVII